MDKFNLTNYILNRFSMPEKNGYDADDIQVLKGLDGVNLSS
ncbi:MAG: hypothetical protein ACFFFT_11715 [Candidatus Thorarchaeota archaeon]